MSIPVGLLNLTLTIKRRVLQGRDSLGNPVYGQPTTGAGWVTIYTGLPARLAFSSKPIAFSKEGERITPNGIMYYNPGYTLLPEDRVITPEGIEYTIISVVAGRAIGNTIDHHEAVLQLP